MKLSEAVALYVARRRSEGAQFISTEIVLKSLCKSCGNIDLSELTSERVIKFLKLSQISIATLITRFSVVRCFVNYSTARNQLPILVLPRPPVNRNARWPYVYTRNQLHTLLEAAQKHSYHNDSFDGETMRMILLLLYATGATFEEVLNLRIADVDLVSGCISFRENSRRPIRSLPIGTDLQRELADYIKNTSHANAKNDLLVSSKNGDTIRRNNLWYRFSALHKSLGMAKTAAGHGPRLHDLKFTFAVHRLSLCIQRGETLNQIVPALSSYLGYTRLTKAEEYLAYVPERFNEDLQKLSPATRDRHWRDVPGLLKYLDTL